ncbi:OmpA family protein [Saccharibacter sp. 17.LH.SD]|uniref:OmpA family protein n=1 Tax=Saccharibacter sp. 17.LH.SD TaxID=2689393 RepID=UPI00136B81B8|nr:OmpA family protein [Saccharibacter sp. 17.LH.SD]MXV43572.1 OmpA family protein [Saccharibacter sp. 17.LH.SD]
MFKLSLALRRYAPALLGSAVLASTLGGCVSHTPRDNYVVFFDRDSVSLNSTAEAIVKEAVQDARAQHVKHIYVAASAGHEGDPAVLKQLADARAVAVVETLEKDGVDVKTIRKSSYTLGQFDDARVALRRVIIRIEKP